MVKDAIPQLADLSTEQKFELISELWDEVLEHPEDLPVHTWQRAELDRSYEEYRQQPERALPWAVVKERLRHGA
jgi:putative addiction module component (TIGR02574 family)